MIVRRAQRDGRGRGKKAIATYENPGPDGFVTGSAPPKRGEPFSWETSLSLQWIEGEMRALIHSSICLSKGAHVPGHLPLSQVQTDSASSSCSPVADSPRSYHRVCPLSRVSGVTCRRTGCQRTHWSCSSSHRCLRACHMRPQFHRRRAPWMLAHSGSCRPCMSSL